jgi:hypothetical protein
MVMASCFSSLSLRIIKGYKAIAWAKLPVKNFRNPFETKIIISVDWEKTISH